MRRRAHHPIPLVRMVASAFLFALPLMLTGCQPDLVSPYPGTPTDAQLQTLHSMEARMTEIRGLEPLRGVEYAFVSRGLLNRTTDDYVLWGARTDLRAPYITYYVQPAYELLGFIPLGEDLVGLRARLCAARVAAFYDPGWYTIVFVGERLPLDDRTNAILAHEFVHALQDQHFDLYELRESAAGGEHDWDAYWDATLALKALIEGDATVAMEQYAPMSVDLKDPRAAYYMERAESTYGAFPVALEEEFAFPYEAGQPFVEALLTQGGWQAVNGAYSHPPTTTEQVLHPEKYRAGEAAREVIPEHLTDRLGQFWYNTSGTLGEFLLRTLLETHLGEAEAASAAAGWGGDLWAIYSDLGENNHLLRLVIEWDSPAELDEFFTAYLKWLDIASNGSSQVLSADAAIWHGYERSVYVSRGDGRATLLISSDWAALEEARKALALP
jgi:hypothetical protein